MNTTNPHRRLFLGIALSGEVLSNLVKWRNTNPILSGIRWIPPQNLHITVYFFGNVPEERMENLISLIAIGLKNIPCFDLEFDRYVYAPHPREARMIWARYKKMQVFRDLATRIHELYLQISPQQQRKSPIPHITLARLQDFSDPAKIDLKSSLSPRILSVKELILWESSLRPEGSVYEVISRFPLSRV
ncbi:MAG: RNA 2',3'-cyclic phosphodiesterase [Bacteroidia bacterium]|nr:RNA 2',3'-cyclic phosphodiesterase [Bacteroidia bacterium]